MARETLSSEKVHDRIRSQVENFHRDTIEEVKQALADHEWVIVGMAQNPFPKRARKTLDKRGIAYKYLEFGSYMSQWRPRLALKLWSGWPTFPMIFRRGELIGGATDLESYLQDEQ